MTIQEFSDQFDVLYNNITSNQAPGLNEYEKSLFLTKAEKEIVKNHFTANSKGNDIGQGFDDSAKRQADFSILMKTDKCSFISGVNSTKKYEVLAPGEEDATIFPDVYFTEGTLSTVIIPSNGTYDVTFDGMMYHTGSYLVHGIKTNSSCTLTVTSVDKIDQRSGLYSFPTDVFIMVNETATVDTAIKQVIPLRYDEYTRLMSKPFKRPLKNQVWRLINSGSMNTDGHSSTKMIELIFGPEVLKSAVPEYKVRYIRVPKPIIVGNMDGLKIDGYEYDASAVCEIDPILHEDILQRAVELAKVAWTATGNDNAQMVLQAGQRSE